MTRRDFLELIAALAGASVVGCDSGGGGADLGPDAGLPDAEVPGLDVPFGIWRSMLEGIRQSPDHLAARAEALVAGGDPVALLDFVRDVIRLLPDTGDGDQEVTETRMYWGPKVALRCGSGTARTKAELLADLYRQAGFADAQVVVGPVDIRGAECLALFLAGEAPAFEPALSEADLETWAAAFEATSEGEDTPDEGAAQSNALADALLLAVPQAWYRRGRIIGSRLRRVPLVQLTVGGEVRFANPVLPGISFGESGTSAEPTPAAPSEMPPVRVALGYTRSDTEDEVQPLVERTWTVDEVAGRQVVAQLVPALDFDTLVATDLDQVRMFLPTLRVVGPDVDVATGSALMAPGDPITLEGERVRRDPMSGAITVEEDAIDVPAEDPPAALARVEYLGITVSPANFGRIGVRIRALDAVGAPVAGLTAGAFRVEEEDTLRAHLLTTSLGKPPRVLFFLDVSVSVPPAFRVEGAAAIARDVAARVVAEVPDAQFRSASLIGGYRTYGNWTSDPEALHRASLEAGSTSSRLWYAAAESTRTKPTLIVMITDGETTDEANDERLRLILAGPPIVGIHVTDDAAGVTFLNELARLTHGGYFPVTEPQQAIDAIVGFLDIERETRYHLRYTALAQGPDERRVRVSLADGRLQAEATYRVPPESQRTERPYLTGLFLTVEAQGRSVTRPLAGFDRTGRFATPDAPGVWAELRDQFFGVTTVSFEGGAPTTAAWLDDVLTSRLSQEPIYRALQAGDVDRAREHMGTVGLRSPHPELVTAHPPLERTPDIVTYENGLRVVMLNERPDLEQGVFREKMDILPLTLFASVSADPAAGYAATIRHTARRAVWEAARYPTSTLSELAGVELAPWDSGEGLPGFLADSENGTRWRALVRTDEGHNRLMPAGGAPFAWWSIHEVFGELRGILADGSGGGDREQQIRNEIADVKKLIGLLKKFYRGQFGTAIGVAVAYASTLASLYGLAAIVITTLNAEGVEEEVRSEIANLACSVLMEFFPIVPSATKLIIKVMTGQSVCGLLT